MLSKEQRAEIEAMLADGAWLKTCELFYGEKTPKLLNIISDLLVDGKYWCNAVKTAHISEVDGECYDGECPFCGCDRYFSLEAHRPSCPWLLAQEDK